MPRYRVSVRLEARHQYVDVEVWAEDEQAAEREAEKLAPDEADPPDWDYITADDIEEIETNPEDPDYEPPTPAAVMRSLGVPELPGLVV